MDELHASACERIAAAAIATDSSPAWQPEKLEQYPGPPSVISASSDVDELDLMKLGYKSVLARGWGSFDNFACSFSALYCIGGIRVLFYIALSNGGPAAMYVLILPTSLVYHMLIKCAKDGVRGSREVSCQ
jgi:hypothetical protein